MPQTITLPQLAIAVLPAIAVIVILYWHQGKYQASLVALLRMFVQLLLVGYVLTTIFLAEAAWIVGIVLVIMVCAASWISLRTVARARFRLIGYSLVSIFACGGAVLSVILFGVLDLEPWFSPRYAIPLSGMIFATCMNAISLASDRFSAEIHAGVEVIAAKRIALEASLIPVTNSLLAVGLVSIPGMMTGQVLAGVEPVVAARYQIMVMCMLFGAAGLASSCFLQLSTRPKQLAYWRAAKNQTDEKPSDHES